MSGISQVGADGVERVLIDFGHGAVTLRRAGECVVVTGWSGPPASRFGHVFEIPADRIAELIEVLRELVP
jgi:hypothetical protein